MADIPASNWDETDANNDDAAPEGFPEGMAPSGVNNGARAIMGAVKRFWNKINAVKTTAGTTSAYTLTYDVAPAAYADGEIISFVVNATNAADATINVNALGAKALRLFGGNLLAGALVADQIVQARYSSSAGAFDIIPQNGWVRLASASPSGASTVDFDDIPAGVNHLWLVGDLTVSADGADLGVRTAGADGAYDTGAADYSYNFVISVSSSATPTTSAGTDSSMPIAVDVDNGATGVSVDMRFMGIQRAKQTIAHFQSRWTDDGGTVSSGRSGSAVRLESARIAGVRVFPSTGTITGELTLFASY